MLLATETMMPISDDVKTLRGVIAGTRLLAEERGPGNHSVVLDLAEILERVLDEYDDLKFRMDGLEK